MKKQTYMLLIGIIVIFLAQFMFVAVPSGHAQSIQDWSDPINISNSGSANDPLLIVDMNGIFHVIWFDLVDGYKYAESEDSVTWTEPKNVTYPFSSEASQPKFIEDSKGAMHVFWQDNENNLYYNRTLSTELDNPSAWIGGTKLSNSAIEFDVEVDTDGTLHLSYLRSLSTNTDPAGIYYRQFDGSAWSIPVKLYITPYLRSLEPEDAHVRLAVPDRPDFGNVYVVWDIPALKRIYGSVSTDLGKTWSEPYEIVEPEESSGYERPHTAEIEVIGNGVLLTWQTSISGVRCAYSSRWSKDGNIERGENINLFDELGICPERIGFGHAIDGYSLSLLQVQDNLAMLAWKDGKWSELQIQQELSTFLNPITLDPILLGCQYAVVQTNMLFVLGCDEGTSGDIWFTSRALGSVEKWFPPPSAWSSPLNVTSVSYDISSVSSVVDGDNNIHLVWVQSSFSESNEIKPAIYYAKRGGSNWSKPTPIITSLDGLPVELTLSNDNQGRLLLAWVDQKNENLLFTWANASQANIPLEWRSPSILPVTSNLISSPHLLADGIGSLVVSYSVPFNEGRGIYMLRSDNLEEKWLAGSQVFDAVSAGWDSIDRPRVALSGDGKLHMVFSQYPMNGEIYRDGLSYSQSADGGITWSQPVAVNDRPVNWFDIYVLGDQTLHVLWQEKNGEVVTNYHKISTDGGFAWEKLTKISSVNGKLAMTDAVVDVSGQLHFLQLTADKKLIIQEWLWNGSLWNVQEATDVFANLEYDVPTALSVEVTPDGYLSVLITLRFEGEGAQRESRLINIGRRVELADPGLPFSLPALPTPVPVSITTSIPGLQITPTAHPLISDLEDSPSVVRKNILGLVLVGIALILVVVFLWPSRSRKMD